MAVKQKSYEQQSLLSVILGAVGGVAALAAIGLLLRNLSFENRYVYYNPKSLWLPILGGMLLVSMLGGAGGLLIGFNSAGQRRNTRSSLAWLGFFLGALVLALGVSAGVFFYFTRFAVTAGK